MVVSYRELLAQEAGKQARRRQPWRIVVIFLLVFFLLQYAWEMSRGSALEHLVIDSATVLPAASVIRFFKPESGVQAQGPSLVSPQAKLNILNGCEGLETLFLLVSALLAYPFPWPLRLYGLALGTALVFMLNQVRIIMLWQAFLHDRALFAALHGTVLPLLMVAACLIFFMVFIARHESRPD
jgi:exosortase/archaeosortase family protein